jgi:hypothetical protein
MGRRERDKGKRGELELRDLFRSYGFTAERGQQRSGSPDSPDVKHNIPGIHVECKRVERFDMYGSLRQAIQDAGEDMPVVFTRASVGSAKDAPRGEWITILKSHDFMKLLVSLYKDKADDENSDRR